jgi:hypothetical protein
MAVNYQAYRVPGQVRVSKFDDFCVTICEAFPDSNDHQGDAVRGSISREILKLVCRKNSPHVNVSGTLRFDHSSPPEYPEKTIPVWNAQFLASPGKHGTDSVFFAVLLRNESLVQATATRAQKPYNSRMAAV